MPRGKLIVFEGLDRAGKSTQAALLQEKLQKVGEDVVLLKFPDRSTPIGKIINDYLTNKISLSDHAVHLLFSANRWELLPTIENHLSSNTTVILDRYLYSGAVYSAAKQLPSLPLSWAVSPDVGLPQPDLLIFMDLDAAVAANREGFGQERYENATLQARVKTLFGELLGFESDSPGPRVDNPNLEKGILRVNAEGSMDVIHDYIYINTKRKYESVDKEQTPIKIWKP